MSKPNFATLFPKAAPDLAAEAQRWLGHLAGERRVSAHTPDAYARDLRQRHPPVAPVEYLRYITNMNDTTATHSDDRPSVSPPDAVELDAWDTLSRDEQVRRYRAVLADPACDRIADASMDDILAAARERVAARRHG